MPISDDATEPHGGPEYNPAQFPFTNWLDFVNRVARPIVEDDADDPSLLDLYRSVSPYYVCTALTMAANRIAADEHRRQTLARAVYGEGAAPTYYVVVNDLVGGFAISLSDKPLSDHNWRKGESPIADGIGSKEDAELIAMALNKLGGEHGSD